MKMSLAVQPLLNQYKRLASQLTQRKQVYTIDVDFWVQHAPDIAKTPAY
jgi:hypothetical protein